LRSFDGRNNSYLFSDSYSYGRIVRYKVRTEIARNQKSTETKISTPNIPGLEKNVESLNDSSVSNDNDMKWKQAYEKVVSENELLRTRGGDSLLLSQLRERYETCLREKDDLYEKLQVYMKLSDNNTQANGNVGVTSKTIEQLYIELKDENKVNCCAHKWVF
jgi:hypothetical protein